MNKYIYHWTNRERDKTKLKKKLDLFGRILNLNCLLSETAKFVRIYIQFK